MTDALWIILWFVLVAWSVIMHEVAHVVAGIANGWKYNGLIVKPSLFAVGVDLEANGNGRQLWKVALAGPAMSLFLYGFFGLLEDSVDAPSGFYMSLAWFNLAMAIINTLPIPLSDGSQALKSLRANRKESK